MAGVFILFILNAHFCTSLYYILVIVAVDIEIEDCEREIVLSCRVVLCLGMYTIKIISPSVCMNVTA